MENKNYISNTPNAAKLIDSLRHLDYTNDAAILDIIDNSIDAGATQIWVDITAHDDKQPSQIKIVDNGSGMDFETLDEAMKLGSDTPKNAECDLGLYGMGLVTASISMGRRLKVVTRNGDGTCLWSVQDLDTVKGQNKFVKILATANDKVLSIFEEDVLGLQKKHPAKDHRGKELSVSRNGTVVTLSKIDNCKWKTVKGMVDNLIGRIGQTHRKFIQAGTNRIYVNGEEVRPIDPINDYEPTILHEDEIKLEEGTIDIKIALLKDYGDTINRQQKINQTNQGYYIIRNNREIMTGQDLGIFNKHNSLNRLRIEFGYPGTLDKVLSSNFSKSKIALDQSIQDKISRMCSPFIAQVRSSEKKKAAIETEEDFSGVEKYITRKSHLLKTPKVEIEKRNKRRDSSEKGKDKGGKHSSRLNITKKKRISLDSLKVRFEKKAGDEKGPLYEADQERDIIVVSWNVNHPFYADVIAANSDKPNVFNPLAYLIYCFADAELCSGVDSDSREIIENIRYDVGKNLAVLMH